MSLPKIDYPISKITVPSLKKDYSFRPFLVKEEKLLLMAKDSDEDTDILVAIKQVVNNCLLDPLDINKLALFDLEYIFLKLRSISVENVINLSYRDTEDNKIYEFSVDLNEVQVKFPDKIEPQIPITDRAGIIMKYPAAKLYDDKEFIEQYGRDMFQLIVRCIDKIYDGDEVYDAAEYKKEELAAFIEGLSIKTFEKIKTFLLTVPNIEHRIQYKNSLGHDREIVLSSLNDFFQLR